MRDTTTLPEAFFISCICFGWFILASLMTVATGFQSSGSGDGFSDGALTGIVMMEIPLAGMALAILHRRGYAVASLVPQPTWRGAGIGAALYLVSMVLWMFVIQPIAYTQPEQPIDGMMGQTHVSLPAVLLLAVINGTYEEIFLLGFLLRGLRGFGLSFALGMSVLVRMLYHLYQGPVGALDVSAFGVVFGLYYARSSKLWPPVFAHILGDIVPFLPYI